MLQPLAKPFTKTLLVGALALPFTAPVHAKFSEMDELRDQLQQMQSRIAELEAKEAEAPKTYVSSGNDKYKVALSGQVHRAVLYANNNAESEVFHVDSDMASSRFRIEGEAKYNDDITVGTNIELEVESNSTADIEFDSDSNSATIKDRKVEFTVDSKTYGKLWVGQGSTASDGTTEVDLSNTDIVAYSGMGDIASGLNFSDNGVVAEVRPTVGSVFGNLDGLGRDDRLRYDTPRFNGFNLATSVLDNGDWDVAGRYSSEINGAKVAAAVSYAVDTSAASDRTRLGGSASVLLENGLNATVSLAREDDDLSDAPDAENAYVKLGYQFNPTELGLTAVSVDLGQTCDLNLSGDEATSAGIAFVQQVDSIATDFYASYRWMELDRDNTDFHDFHAAIIGARIKI